MTHSRGEEAGFPIPQAGGREICHSRMKIVETSQCGVSMCFIACRGFRNPPSPLKRGRRKATQGLGLLKPPGPLKRGKRKAAQNLGPVGPCPAGVPLLRGSGVSETISQTGCLVGQRPAGVFKMSSKCFQKLPWLVFKMSGRCLQKLPGPFLLPLPPQEGEGDTCRLSTYRT